MFATCVDLKSNKVVLHGTSRWTPDPNARHVKVKQESVRHSLDSSTVQASQPQKSAIARFY